LNATYDCLDDHAFLLAALLELLRGDVLQAAGLRFACELPDFMLGQFDDAPRRRILLQPA
jgi:hypothetical protein